MRSSASVGCITRKYRFKQKVVWPESGAFYSLTSDVSMLLVRRALNYIERANKISRDFLKRRIPDSKAKFQQTVQISGPSVTCYSI